MRTRRQVLALGSAGVAALTVPSLLPSSPIRIAAQGPSSDPLVAELTRQFELAARGLGATPPRGNARQLAALFRMTSAWARANNIDAIVRQRLDDALATEGHQAFVARVAAFDRVGALRAKGLPVTPNVRNHTDAVAIAKAIGWYKGGMTFERLCRTVAFVIDRHAAHFDNQIAIFNNRQPEMILRRVQDLDACINAGNDISSCYDQPPQDDCTQNSDGSWSCSFTQPNVEPPPPTSSGGCSDVESILLYTAGLELSALLEMIGAFGLWGLLVLGVAIDGFIYYIGC